MKRALVTGVAGFIGSALCRRLLAEGWQVWGIDVKRELPEYVHRVGWRVEEDWSHETAPEYDVIYHCASVVGPVGVLQRHGTIACTMLQGMGNVLGNAYGARVIFTSTSEVYGDHAGQPVTEESQMRFEQEPSARREYAIGKLACEAMLQARHADHVIVRPFNVAGPGQDGSLGFVIPRFIQQAQAGEPITLYQPGTQQRAFTHVEDVVDALVLLADLDIPDGAPRLFNLGNPDNQTSLHSLAETVVRATGSCSPIEMVDPQDLHGPGFREAPDKLPWHSRLSAFGWCPWRTLEDIVRDAIEVSAREEVTA